MVPVGELDRLLASGQRVEVLSRPTEGARDLYVSLEIWESLEDRSAFGSALLRFRVNAAL